MCIKRENFEEFIENVCKEVSERMGEQYEVVPATHMRNNGILRRGITITKRETKSGNVYPNIYLEDLYEEYCTGHDYARVVDAIEQRYEAAKADVHFDLTRLMDFESMKGKICFRIVNRSANAKHLENVPCREFQDLAVTYFILAEVAKKDVASISIDNRFLAEWNVSEQELWEVAYENTRKLLPLRTVPMNEAFDEILGFCPDIKDIPTTYIITNAGNTFGAAAVLYSDYIHTFADAIGCDLYFLPMSVHEWYVVPADEGMGRDDYNEMIKEFEETKVISEEVFLSSHVYLYNRNTGEFSF